MAQHDSPLRPVAQDLWVADSPHRFLGLHVGTRMTVVRLASGRLLLHSPVAMPPALIEAVGALGEVGHVVCPNLFHHVYAGDAVRAFPGAQLHGPARLHRKRRDLRFDGALSETPHPDWAADLVPITIEGSLLRETVFYHPASRTLITSDLVENFAGSDDAVTRLYLRLGGILGKVSWHPLLRPVYYRRGKARASVERILELPFDSVIIGHGDLITRDARSSLRTGLSWL